MLLIPVSAGVVFGIGFGFPLILCTMMKCFGSETFKFIEVFTIYGYSYTSFILTAFLCAFPMDAIQWIFILVSALISCGFMIVTYW